MRVDEIRREVRLEAPVERVWAALTDAEEVARWFGDTAEIDLRPGGRARFGWSEFESVTEAIIDVVDEPRRLVYRWEALKDTPVEQISTTVEFVLEAEGRGTKLTMVESGFASLPDDDYDQRFAENNSGWKAEIDDLTVYLAGVSPFE